MLLALSDHLISVNVRKHFLPSTFYTFLDLSFRATPRRFMKQSAQESLHTSLYLFYLYTCTNGALSLQTPLKACRTLALSPTLWLISAPMNRTISISIPDYRNFVTCSGVLPSSNISVPSNLSSLLHLSLFATFTISFLLSQKFPNSVTVFLSLSLLYLCSNTVASDSQTIADSPPITFPYHTTYLLHCSLTLDFTSLTLQFMKMLTAMMTSHTPVVAQPLRGNVNFLLSLPFLNTSAVVPSIPLRISTSHFYKFSYIL